jgi:hypothetical protein
MTTLQIEKAYSSELPNKEKILRALLAAKECVDAHYCHMEYGYINPETNKMFTEEEVSSEIQNLIDCIEEGIVSM